MTVAVINGAMLLCPFGTGPGSFLVLPANKSMGANMPAANIMDNKPFVNIPGFIMCTSMANPATASATSAASGVLTPTPCTPMTAAPWAPGATTSMIGNMPAVNNACTLQCSYGGTITVTYPGQVQSMAK